MNVAKGEPIELFNGLRSFQTPAEAQKSLASPVTMEIVEDAPVKDRMGRQLFRTITAEIPNFADDGHKGRLVLQFLNDRLMRVLFYPEDPEAYLQELQRDGIDAVPDRTWSNRLELTASGQPAVMDGYVYSDIKGGRYFAWEDSRLSAEYHQWVTNYN